MVSAFDRLPSQVSELFGRYLNFADPDLSQLAIPVHQAGLLAQSFSAAVKKQLVDEKCDQGAIDNLETLLSDDNIAKQFKKDALENNNDPTQWNTNKKLGEVAESCGQVLEHFWNKQSVKDAFGRSRPENGRPEGPRALSASRRRSR